MESSQGRVRSAATRGSPGRLGGAQTEQKFLGLPHVRLLLMKGALPGGGICIRREECSAECADRPQRGGSMKSFAVRWAHLALVEG